MTDTDESISTMDTTVSSKGKQVDAEENSFGDQEQESSNIYNYDKLKRGDYNKFSSNE